ncbi:MAG: CDP-diacylglycerol--serine O-phosphatidyltransferase [Bacteroidaceae bacterium]|nr:CDP-diacylglycerol--serine O-phosphatidyltransferase [Bacteroidaceae bacterium]
MKKHIPNTITCCNLVCGCIATQYALNGNFNIALAFIILGATFDFFDGFAARLLHVSSAIGKELDSLADCISFGFAPAAVVYSLLKLSPAITENETINTILPYAAFIIAAFSAVRLAKFNLDERQTTTFFGLPTPANALFWSALAVGTNEWFAQTSWSAYVLLLGAVASAWILVADIPMFALKFKTYALSENKLRYGFIAVSAISLISLGWTGFAFIIPLYIITSIVANLAKK